MTKIPKPLPNRNAHTFTKGNKHNKLLSTTYYAKSYLLTQSMPRMSLYNKSYMLPNNTFLNNFFTSKTKLFLWVVNPRH